jgi:hypothetical protein
MARCGSDHLLTPVRGALVGAKLNNVTIPTHRLFRAEAFAAWRDAAALHALSSYKMLPLSRPSSTT